MVSFHPANKQLNSRCVWTLRSARHGTQEGAVKVAEARSSSLCCSVPLWAARNLGPGYLPPYSLVPPCGHRSLGSYSCLPRWAAWRQGGTPETTDLSPVSPAPNQSGGWEGCKELGVLPLRVKSFFHLVSSQSIQTVQEDPFPSMSYSANPEVSLRV